MKKVTIAEKKAIIEVKLINALKKKNRPGLRLFYLVCLDLLKKARTSYDLEEVVNRAHSRLTTDLDDSAEAADGIFIPVTM
jgi:hypothetical protein